MSARDALAAVRQRADAASPGLVLDAKTMHDWHKVGEVDVRKIARSAADVPAVLDALTAVLDEHPRGECYPPAGHDGTVPTEDDRIDDACQHCAVEWPCPTVAAVETRLARAGERP